MVSRLLTSGSRRVPLTPRASRRVIRWERKSDDDKFSHLYSCSSRLFLVLPRLSSRSISPASRFPSPSLPLLSSRFSPTRSLLLFLFSHTSPTSSLLSHLLSSFSPSSTSPPTVPFLRPFSPLASLATSLCRRRENIATAS